MTPLQREAAEWAARMRGPDAKGHAERFEAWHSKPGHAEAYALALEDFALSAGVSRARIEAKAGSARTAPGGWRWATAALLVGSLALAYAWHIRPDQDETKIAAAHDGQSVQTLADGTRVTLAHGARIEQQFSSGRRLVVLTGGQARFEVAHDAARPFTVLAGRSETTALGTIFEIDLRGEVPRIHLVSGSVDVRTSGSARALRLGPGDTAEVPQAGPRMIGEPMTSPVPATSLDADALPLGAVVERANMVNAKPIRLAEPALASLPVTGRFEVANGSSLARKLAAALNLELVESATEIVLRKK